jgi:hypothetical protein
VVWAKVKGYPWWPARILGIGNYESGDKKYEVFFIKDDSRAMLPKLKLRKFRESFSDFSKTKRAKLKEAIKQA